MAIEIPESAAFYVRSSLNRALQQVQNDIDVLTKPENIENCPDYLKGTAASTVAHCRQWYKEAVAEFRQLPESIRPDQDLLDYEVK